MSFRFIHTADLHLDTPFRGIGQVAPEVAQVLRDASLNVFDAIVQLAIDRDVAFVLFSGDIYDGAERGVRAQLRFQKGLERLDARGIHAFITYGNHDPLNGWSAIRHWPVRTHRFGSEEVGSVVVEGKDGPLATVHGISYAQRHVKENLAAGFSANDEGLQVAMLHCEVGNPESPYAPCELADLERAGMDYWALGHIHARRVLRERAPTIVYPGNSQGRSFNDDECGAKGVIVVHADQQEIKKTEFVPLDAVRFQTVAVDITELDDIAQLRDALVMRAHELSQQEECGLVLRFRLEGRGIIHTDLSRPGAAQDMLGEVREELSEHVPLIWCDRLSLETRPLIDLDSLRRRDDFTGTLLRLAADLCAADEMLPEASRVLNATGAGQLQRLIGDRCDAWDAEELLRQAELMAAELTGGEANG